MSFAEQVDQALAEIGEILKAKNAAYGNSVLEPVRVFSQATPVERIKDRIDDKISRMQKGNGTGDEDAELDLLGYLVLLRIARAAEAGWYAKAEGVSVGPCESRDAARRVLIATLGKSVGTRFAFTAWRVPAEMTPPREGRTCMCHPPTEFDDGGRDRCPVHVGQS